MWKRYRARGRMDTTTVRCLDRIARHCAYEGYRRADYPATAPAAGTRTPRTPASALRGSATPRSTAPRVIGQTPQTAATRAATQGYKTPFKTPFSRPQEKGRMGPILVSYTLNECEVTTELTDRRTRARTRSARSRKRSSSTPTALSGITGVSANRAGTRASKRWRGRSSTSWRSCSIPTPTMVSPTFAHICIVEGHEVRSGVYNEVDS